MRIVPCGRIFVCRNFLIPWENPLHFHYFEYTFCIYFHSMKYAFLILLALWSLGCGYMLSWWFPIHSISNTPPPSTLHIPEQTNHGADPIQIISIPGQESQLPRFRLMTDTYALHATTPYILPNMSSGEVNQVISLNFPAFFDLTPAEIDQVREQIGSLTWARWQLSFTDDDTLDTVRLTSILESLNISGSVSIHWMRYPQNIWEVFEAISWKKSDQTNLSVYYYSTFFPYGLSGDLVLKYTIAMIERIQGDMPLQRLSLTFGHGADSLKMWFVTEEVRDKITHIKTHHLQVQNIAPNFSGHHMQAWWEAFLRKWLESSPIEHIYWMGVGNKTPDTEVQLWW